MSGSEGVNVTKGTKFRGRGSLRICLVNNCSIVALTGGAGRWQEVEARLHLDDFTMPRTIASAMRWRYEAERALRASPELERKPHSTKADGRALLRRTWKRARLTPRLPETRANSRWILAASG